MNSVANTTQQRNKKRIFYLDALRALAITAVVLVHVFEATKGFTISQYAVIPSTNWFISDFLTVCFRFGVDLFLMLAGALSLGRVWTIKSFLKRRIPRIVLPFAFWGFVLSVIFILFAFVSTDFSNFVNFNSFTFESISNFIVNAYLAKSRSFKTYWFFWMILGTYLIMPIFNKWLANSSLEEAEYFLVIWLITALFDYTLFTKFPIKLSYFTSPIGLVVLGYYLRHTKRKIFNSLPASLIFIVVGAVSMMFISYLLSSTTSFYRFDRYSILMVILVTGIFLLFKNLDNVKLDINFFKNPNGIFRKSIFSLAKYSYGIYLIHNTLLTFIYFLIRDSLHGHFKILLLSCFIGALLGPWIIMAVLNRIPYIKKIIGAK